MTDTLTIFGSPASQPSRTVFWACLLKGLPFELGNARDPALSVEQTNPRGQVPWIVEGDFVLAEMAAIVCYLAEKHRWSDLYPEDLKTRARIQQFLHMHHSFVRAATLKLMAPHVIKPIAQQMSRGGTNPLSVMGDVLTAAYAAQNPLEEGGAVVQTIVEFLEEFYFSDASTFVCGTAGTSIADLALYGEIGQFVFARLFDFADYPKTMRWLDAMRAVPYHDVVHAYNITLGDIATLPNTMERFTAANQAGVDALKGTGLVS